MNTKRRIGKNNGYQLIYKPEHPRAWKTGYVYEHIIVMEEQLGRNLHPREVVHHKDKNKLNNEPFNLELLDPSSHAKVHARPQVFVDLVCPECHKSFKRRKGNEPKPKGYKDAFCSRSCNGKYHNRGGFSFIGRPR